MKQLAYFSLEQWSSTGSNFVPHGYLAMSGDILDITTWGREGYWHLMGRHQGCSTPYRHRTPLQKRLIQPQIATALRLEKPCHRDILSVGVGRTTDNEKKGEKNQGNLSLLNNNL